MHFLNFQPNAAIIMIIFPLKVRSTESCVPRWAGPTWSRATRAGVGAAPGSRPKTGARRSPRTSSSCRSPRSSRPGEKEQDWRGNPNNTQQHGSSHKDRGQHLSRNPKPIRPHSFCKRLLPDPEFKIWMQGTSNVNVTQAPKIRRTFIGFRTTRLSKVNLKHQRQGSDYSRSKL